VSSRYSRLHAGCLRWPITVNLDCVAFVLPMPAAAKMPKNTQNLLFAEIYDSIGNNDRYKPNFVTFRHKHWIIFLSSVQQGTNLQNCSACVDGITRRYSHDPPANCNSSSGVLFFVVPKMRRSTVAYNKAVPRTRVNWIKTAEWSLSATLDYSLSTYSINKID